MLRHLTLKDVVNWNELKIKEKLRLKQKNIQFTTILNHIMK